MKTRRCPQCGAPTFFSEKTTRYLDPQTGEHRKTGDGYAISLTLFIVCCIIIGCGWAYLASVVSECSKSTDPVYQDGCGMMVVFYIYMGAIIVIGLMVTALFIALIEQGKRTVLSQTNTVIHSFTCRKCLRGWTVIQEPQESTEGEESSED